MPFEFLRRRRKPATDERATGPSGSSPGRARAPASGSGGGGAVPSGSGATAVPGALRGIAFDGLTEEWRIAGRISAAGRLSDVLNHREALAVDDVRWAQISPEAQLEPAPGIRSIDPYDLIVVLAGEDSLPPQSEEERLAHRIHKIPYDVALELPPYRVVGTIYLYPGSEPESLMQRTTEMFVPVVDATATLDQTALTPEPVDAILVNRFYLRGIEQVDRTTGEPVAKFPGEAPG